MIKICIFCRIMTVTVAFVTLRSGTIFRYLVVLMRYQFRNDSSNRQNLRNNNWSINRMIIRKKSYQSRRKINRIRISNIHSWNNLQILILSKSHRKIVKFCTIRLTQEKTHYWFKLTYNILKINNTQHSHQIIYAMKLKKVI